MRCAWQMFVNLLPIWMREDVDKQGRETLQELRLRLHAPPKMIMQGRSVSLSRPVSIDDLNFCINVASRYSPWAAQTIGKGYITAPGGHRIGICGFAAQQSTTNSALHQVTSLCIRICRDFPGLAAPIADLNGSILIIGRPGCGKTTLLRDIIRQWSDKKNLCISVVDEREEIFPYAHKQLCYPTGENTDILTGQKKQAGVEAVLRNMSPDVIAMDEITASEDCASLLHAGWCGVSLLATAHAGSREDLFHRPVYQPILDCHLFDHLIIMNQDKSWTIERM